MEKEELNKKFEGLEVIITKENKMGFYGLLFMITTLSVLIFNEPLLIYLGGVFLILSLYFSYQLGSGQTISKKQKLFYYSFKAKKFLEQFESTNLLIFLKYSKKALSKVSFWISHDYDAILSIQEIEDNPRFQVIGNLRKILNNKILPRLQNKIDLKIIDKVLVLLSEFFYLQLPEIKNSEIYHSLMFKEEIGKRLDELYQLFQEMEEIKTEEVKIKEHKITLLSLTRTFEHRNILIRFLWWFSFIFTLSVILAFSAYRYFSIPINDLIPVVISVSILGPVTIVGLLRPRI